ncbi:MAG: hypothetical protein VB084_06325 [Syntrophomonadaceae bacterium]|nr:hypothetical protein [Syntrophomonadaceae bacterium]
MKKWLVLMMLSIFVAATLVGCGSKPTTTTTDAPTTTDNKPADSGNDLSKLMQSAIAVKEMSFDMVMTVNDKTFLNHSTYRSQYPGISLN